MAKKILPNVAQNKKVTIQQSTNRLFTDLYFISTASVFFSIHHKNSITYKWKNKQLLRNVNIPSAFCKKWNTLNYNEISLNEIIKKKNNIWVYKVETCF